MYSLYGLFPIALIEFVRLVIDLVLQNRMPKKCQSAKYGREAEIISYSDLYYLSLSLHRKYQASRSQVAVPSCMGGVWIMRSDKDRGKNEDWALDQPSKQE